jgi:mRNA-degrading endonuclease RelE of RelBE toxin-antitoxin system
MSFNVKTIHVFERQAKRLMKKFPSLKKEIQALIQELKEEPTKGTSIGYNCYKIRLAIASKGKGKSGGARIITHLVFKNDIVYLLTIYDKSELENLSDNEILELIKLIP